MSFRHPKNEVLSRARSPEDKARVREAFIEAGRRLLAREDASRISLRRVAAEAGYAPGTIYQYFHDQEDLFFHLRGHDMDAATAAFTALIARTRDPARRVQKLFIGTADHWLAHMDEFLVIFPAPSLRPVPEPAPGDTAMPFGESRAVRDILKLYYDTVDGFFQTLPHPPMPSRLATDTLMAAVHGMIVFPCMARTMAWSDTRAMVVKLVNTVVAEWSAAGQRPRGS